MSKTVIFSRSQRLELVLKHGSSSLAYSTLQKGMQYFEVPDKGYIAFDTIKTGFGRTTAVLGDPICDASDTEHILRLFVEAHPKAIFWQIHRHTAERLGSLGYYVNEVGLDSIIDLEEFKGSWGTHKALRREAKKAERVGVEIEEHSVQDVDIQDLERIDSEWLATKRNNSEGQRFLTRPLVLETEKDVRSFFAFKEGRIIGYRFFDPLYKGGKVIGYYADITRTATDAPNGTAYLLALEAMKTFKQEKLYKLTLGFSPFAKVSMDSGLRSSRPAHWFFRHMYFGWEKVYGLQGLYEHKKRFHGEEVKVYLASRSLFPVGDIINTYYLTGIDVVRQMLLSFKGSK